MIDLPSPASFNYYLEVMARVHELMDKSFIVSEKYTAQLLRVRAMNLLQEIEDGFLTTD